MKIYINQLYYQRIIYISHQDCIKKKNSSPPSPKDKCELLYLCFWVLSCTVISSIHYHLLLNYLTKQKEKTQYLYQYVNVVDTNIGFNTTREKERASAVDLLRRCTRVDLMLGVCQANYVFQMIAINPYFYEKKPHFDYCWVLLGGILKHCIVPRQFFNKVSRLIVLKFLSSVECYHINFWLVSLVWRS